MKHVREDETYYFHGLGCKTYTAKWKGLEVPFAEGKLQWTTPNVNCCRKIRKTYAELPAPFKDFLAHIDELDEEMALRREVLAMVPDSGNRDRTKLRFRGASWPP